MVFGLVFFPPLSQFHGSPTSLLLFLLLFGCSMYLSSGVLSRMAPADFWYVDLYIIIIYNFSIYILLYPFRYFLLMKGKENGKLRCLSPTFHAARLVQQH